MTNVTRGEVRDLVRKHHGAPTGQRRHYARRASEAMRALIAQQNEAGLIRPLKPLEDRHER